MSPLEACRLCLEADTRLQTIANTPLQETFERITNKPLQSNDGKPITACYICCSLLRNSRRFFQRALQAEELLQLMLNRGMELTAASLRKIDSSKLERLRPLAVTGLELCSVPLLPCQPLKMELDVVKTEMNLDLEAGEPVIAGLPVTPLRVEDSLTITKDFQNDITKETAAIDYIKQEAISLKQLGTSIHFEHFEAFESDVEHALGQKGMTGSGQYMPAGTEQAGTRRVQAMAIDEEFIIKSEEELSGNYAEETPREETEASELTDADSDPAGQSDINRADEGQHPQDVQSVWVECERCGAELKRELLEDHMKLFHLKAVVQLGRIPNAVAGSGEPFCSRKPDSANYAETHSGEKLYSCNECAMAFSDKSKLIAHIMTHVGEKPHLSQHIITHTGKEPYRCNQCDKAFSTKSSLKIHIRTHTGEKPYRCNQCAMAFRCKSNLIQHIRTHTGKKPYRCNQCDKAFSTKSTLKRHIRAHTGKKPYRCNQCEKAFSQKSHLIEHIRTHTGEKPYRCNQCAMAFRRKGNLIQHIRTHTGKKPYRCNQCHKAVSTKSNLKMHIRTHTGEKPYRCNQCDKAFSTKNSLKIHIRTHTGEKPYRCNQCDKAYGHKNHLNMHIRTHTGEKPYRCNQCHKAFSLKGILDVHIKTHTGEKTYRCNQCNKAFRLRSCLNNHIRTHTGEKPYRCKRCNKSEKSLKQAYYIHTQPPAP